MSSSYKRDDKKFRAQIAALADAGLNLHVGANCSIQRARPCNECTITGLLEPQAQGFTFGKAYKLGDIPAYVRVIEPPAPKIDKPLPRRHKVAEVVGGLAMWIIVILMVSGFGLAIVEAVIRVLGL
jgi:hypothetical protein